MNGLNVWFPTNHDLYSGMYNKYCLWLSVEPCSQMRNQNDENNKSFPLPITNFIWLLTLNNISQVHLLLSSRTGATYRFIIKNYFR